MANEEQVRDSSLEQPERSIVLPPESRLNPG